MHVQPLLATSLTAAASGLLALSTQAAVVVDFGSAAGKFNENGANFGSSPGVAAFFYTPDALRFKDFSRGPGGLSVDYFGGAVGFAPGAAGVLPTENLTLTLQLTSNGAGASDGNIPAPGTLRVNLFGDDGLRSDYTFTYDQDDVAAASNTNSVTLLSDQILAAPINGVYNPLGTYGSYQLRSTALPGTTGSYRVDIDNIATTLVPEPTSAALVAAGGLLFLRRRR